MNRLLFDGFENFGLQLVSINGGSLRNAIPRESNAEIIIAKMYEDVFEYEMQNVILEIKEELKTKDANLDIVLTPKTAAANVMDLGVQEGLIRALYAAHNGVYRMSPDMADLVETSNNIAKITVGNGEITIKCLTRSSVESSKMDLANALRSTFELMGCEVNFSGSYPGWTPKVDSEILNVLSAIYEKQNGNKARVVACHAGLECGLLGTHYPEMDMISFGPTIKGAHSPDERASISSAQKYWKFVLEVLENIPQKA